MAHDCIFTLSLLFSMSLAVSQVSATKLSQSAGRRSNKEYYQINTEHGLGEPIAVGAVSAVCRCVGVRPDRALGRV
jgi:hypothetical protein